MEKWLEMLAECMCDIFSLVRKGGQQTWVMLIFFFIDPLRLISSGGIWLQNSQGIKKEKVTLKLVTMAGDYLWYVRIKKFQGCLEIKVMTWLDPINCITSTMVLWLNWTRRTRVSSVVGNMHKYDLKVRMESHEKDYFRFTYIEYYVFLYLILCITYKNKTSKHV